MIGLAIEITDFIVQPGRAVVARSAINSSWSIETVRTISSVVVQQHVEKRKQAKTAEESLQGANQNAIGSLS